MNISEPMVAWQEFKSGLWHKELREVRTLTGSRCSSLLRSVAVNESDHISVTLSCAASGRPKPSIRVVRVDTGQPLEVDTSHTSGQDENVQQYTLTTSARCQDAAIYRCEASNRVGSDEENVTLFVNFQNEKVLDAGVYRLTVGNVAGDFSFYVKLNVHAVTEKVGSVNLD
nr:hypothetical protein BaRGS_007228 [Batillaria attramentaria]